jgi:enoyl-CoA hydratase
MRYASADAFFVIQEINIGMTADVGTLQRLPKIIPDGVARELAYTGRRLSAERAREVGLVNQVFATHEELVSGVLEIADEIASKSPLAIWGTKEMVLYSRDHSVADGLDHIATWQTGMFQPADMAEAFTARAEGRRPEFPDLLPVPEEF